MRTPWRTSLRCCARAEAPVAQHLPCRGTHMRPSCQPHSDQPPNTWRWALRPGWASLPRGLAESGDGPGAECFPREPRNSKHTGEAPQHPRSQRRASEVTSKRSAHSNPRGSPWLGHEEPVPPYTRWDCRRRGAWAHSSQRQKPVQMPVGQTCLPALRAHRPRWEQQTRMLALRLWDHSHITGQQ